MCKMTGVLLYLSHNFQTDRPGQTNTVFKGLFREFNDNVQIILHYVKSDMGISHLQMLSA